MLGEADHLTAGRPRIITEGHCRHCARSCRTLRMAEMRVLVIAYAESRSGLVTRLLTHALEKKGGRTRIILLARRDGRLHDRVGRVRGRSRAMVSFHPMIREAR